MTESGDSLLTGGEVRKTQPFSTGKTIAMLFKNWTWVLSIGLLSTIVLMAIFVPIFSQYTYRSIDVEVRFLGPCAEHWFGTDSLGRDTFVRTWYAARLSLTVALVTTLINLLLGVSYGMTAGLFGGVVDEMMMRFIDIFDALPFLLIAILLAIVLGNGMFSIIFVLGLFRWLGVARLVRNLTTQLNGQLFIQASVALGASRWRLARHHILPNILGQVITKCTSLLPGTIYAEALLSILGLGVQVPSPSWGTMIRSGLNTLGFSPWLTIAPSVLVCITTLSFNLVGDILRETFDPRLSK